MIALSFPAFTKNKMEWRKKNIIDWHFSGKMPQLLHSSSWFNRFHFRQTFDPKHTLAVMESIIIITSHKIKLFLPNNRKFQFHSVALQLFSIKLYLTLNHVNIYLFIYACTVTVCVFVWLASDAPSFFFVFNSFHHQQQQLQKMTNDKNVSSFSVSLSLLLYNTYNICVVRNIIFFYCLTFTLARLDYLTKQIKYSWVFLNFILKLFNL